MNCKEVRRGLDIHLTTISEEMKLHLQQCKACSRYYDDVMYLRSLPVKTDRNSSTPEWLKAKTLKMCQSILATKSAQKNFSLRERIKRVWQSPKFVLAVALLALAVLLVMSGISDATGSSQSVRSFAVQMLLVVLVQNIIISVFSPLILFYYKIK
jgi:cytochrome c-type biogenesis protein CcmH/NrfG